jgi:hypothetical protein
MDHRDLAHRSIWTAVETWTALILTLALADATGFSDVSLSVVETATVGALASIVTVIKEFARHQLQGERNGDDTPPG